MSPVTRAEDAKGLLRPRDAEEPHPADRVTPRTPHVLQLG